MNGNSTTATVFATDHDTSIAAIATKIAALAGVKSAVVTPGARDITIIGNNVAVTASAVTTAGASQGTWTQVQTSNDVLRGISVSFPFLESSASTALLAFLLLLMFSLTKCPRGNFKRG